MANESYQMFRRKTFEALTQKKIKKKWLRGINRGRQKDDEQGSDSSYFVLKNDFQLDGRNQAKNQKNLKIGLTDRKESKEESSQPKSFSLKIWIFDRLKNRFNQLNHGKLENFENLDIFCKNFFKTNFYDMKCMFMTSSDLQNQNFLRKIQNLSNFFNLFFPHSPKMN